MHVFASDLQSESHVVFHAIHDNSGWSNWRTVLNVGSSPRQVSVTNAHGELDLVGCFIITSMPEFAVE